MPTKFGQKNQNCTHFNSLQEIEEFFARRVRYTGLLNSNMLPEFFDGAKGVVMATKNRQK